MSSTDPYCGSPPVPADIWGRWLLDPVLGAVLLGTLLGYVLHMRRHSVSAAYRRDAQMHWFVAGWAALVLGWMSPLCALSVALFSARALQHMWVTLIAAPLLAMARLDRVVANETVRALIAQAARPMVAAAAFAIALWAWHVPRLYQLTFQSDMAYWAMHLTHLGSAILLWHAILHGAREQLGSRFFAGFFTLAQMGALGALLTLTPRLLYPVHWLTAQTWSLTPLQDQQLGGLIMWVPGCTAVVLTLLIMFADFLRTAARSDVVFDTKPL